MGANFSRLKTWVSTEDLEFDDLNAEFDNILTNLTPSGVDDYSANVSQMQSTTDPGEVGTESLATSTAGELQRLRFMLKEITGEDQWYESPVNSLAGISNALGTGIQANRLASGRKRSDVSASLSAQPVFLVPNGAAKTVKLDGTPINFVYYINGTAYTISTDTTLSGLTAAPSSQNTCLVDDSTAADQDWTKYQGENGTQIPVDTMGTEISSLVGKFAAFKIAGTTDEYFIAHVTSTTSLRKAQRGYFFDSSDNPVPRAGYTNNDTITLMKLSWIFAKTDLSLDVTYTNPVWGKDEPSSPAAGDYWYDTDNQTWKKYSGTSFSSATATLVGVCIQDATNTVGARSFEFFLNYTSLNTFELVAESNTQVKTRLPAQANVWGNTIKNDYNLYTWDMTADLDSGVSENSSTDYHFYLTEEGDKVISDVKPHDRRGDLGGYYHPFNSWRAIGYARNDGSSNLSAVNSYFKQHGQYEILPAQTATFRVDQAHTVIPVSTTGGTFTFYLPPAAQTRGNTFLAHKTTDDFTAGTISTVNSENIVNGGTSATTITLNTLGEMWEFYSDGTAYYVMRHQVPSEWRTYTPTLSAGFGTVSTIEAYYKRHGDSLHLLAGWTNGTVAASAATITLPTGLTTFTTSQTTHAGIGLVNANATYPLILLNPGNVSVLSFSIYGNVGVNPFTTQNGNTVSATGNIVRIVSYPIRIAGWSA